MSVAPSPPPRRAEPEPGLAPTPASAVPPLVEGQRLDQPTFHARYGAMPPGTRAELIEGVVSMPSPAGAGHGGAVVALVVWLDRYVEHTPGTEALDNVTVILGWRSEPQPDLVLRVLPAAGGRTRDQEGYVAGSPELVVEVARSSRYLDLGPKFEAYERAGVQEYLVRSVEPAEVLWYGQEGGRFVPIPPDAEGRLASRAFPGLWLDPAALLAGDRAGVRAALDLGLAAPEHAAFVARLDAARNPPAPAPPTETGTGTENPAPPAEPG